MINKYIGITEEIKRSIAELNKNTIKEKDKILELFINITFMLKQLEIFYGFTKEEIKEKYEAKLIDISSTL